MATWKKILHEDSTIAITQIENLNDIEEGQVIIGSTGGEAQNYDLSHKAILMGSTGNDAKITTLVASEGAEAGDIVVEATSSPSGSQMSAQLHIIDGVISEGKLIDNAVSLAKIKHQSDFGIMVYDDSTTPDDGVPTFLTGGTAGQVIKVNSTADGWEFADAASASTVDISTHDLIRRPVIIGGDADNDSDTGATLRKDQPNFNYLADQTFSSSLYKNNVNSTVGPASDSGAIADLHVDHIKTNITGTAGASVQTYTSQDITSDVYFPIPFGNDTDSGPAEYNTFNGLSIDKSFHYNPAEGALTVKNLVVTGTNTVVESQNLFVEDNTIRVSTGDNVTVSSAVNSGLVVNIGTAGNAGGDENTAVEANADDTLPRILWSNDSTTTKGWVIADKGVGTGPSGLAGSTARGIAILNHNGADIAQNTLDASYDHGIGAFFLVDTNGTPELYIQVA